MSRGAHPNSNASSDERDVREGGANAREGNSKEHETREGGAIAIDSYNVHRLVIAGLTVASKFFSDVFYLNSRYAKVRFSVPVFGSFRSA